MYTTVVICNMHYTYLKWLLTIDIHCSYNFQRKNEKYSYEQRFSDFIDVIEQVKKSKMCLKIVDVSKTMKEYFVVYKYDILKKKKKKNALLDQLTK
jgi:hypothetical protein